MADYPILAPTLAALQGVKDLPQGTEDPAKLDDVDRQTRNWIYDFLSIYIDTNTGKIKSSAFGIGTSFPAGVIRGTNPVDSSQREIAQGTVGTLDLTDGAVTNAKIANGTIQGAKIASGAIQGSNIADATITSDKVAAGVLTTSNIADGSITDPKIALGTITGQRLADSTITNAKMGGRSALGPQLPVATEGQILVGGNGANADEVAAKTLNGSFVINKDGLLSYAGLAGALVSFARIVEQAATNVGGGTSVVGWQNRGDAPAHPWSLIQFTRDFLTIFPGAIYFKEPGTYLISVRAPIQGVGGVANHKLVLVYLPNNRKELYYGLSVDSPNGITNYSTLDIILNVKEEDFTGQVADPYFYIQHFVKAFAGANGLGQATNATVQQDDTATSPEYYAQITILRILEPGAEP